MEYRIVEAEGPEDLATEVNQLIEEGWEPQSGLTYTPPINNVRPERFYQVLIRFDESDLETLEDDY